MRRFVVAIVSLLSIPLLMACDSGTGGVAPGSAPGASPAAQKTVFAVGQAMIGSNGHSVTVNSFKRKFKSGNPYLQPTKGNECVQVNFTLSNGDTSEWSLPTYELKVLDANGQTYDTSFTCGGTSTNISSLIAAGHAKATEIFEVPSGVVLDVAWKPDTFEATVLQTHLK